MPKIGLFFLLIYILLRLIFWFAAFPNSDEAYYWLWAQHPALSYYDHPPLQAWLQSIMTHLFGRSNFALRSSNVLSNLVFFYTYYRITIYLYGKQNRAMWGAIALLILASPLYFLFLGLAWHDHLLITFTLVSAYLFIRFLDRYLVDCRGESWRLYGAAGAIALAGLSKYSAVFVGLGFLATIGFNSRLRPLLKDRRLYFAGAIALSALLPILAWNVSNNFQSFQYYFNRSINPVTPGLKLGSLLTFLITSVLIVSPFHWIGFYRLLKKPPHLSSTYPMVAFWVFAISSIVLTILSFISAALYYWNITAYLLLFPLLPMVVPSFQLKTQIYGAIVAALVVVHYTVLPLSALTGQGSDFDSGMLFGWNEVATVVKTQAAELPIAPLLVTTDYRSASALAYELNDKNVIAISDRVDQFDFWYRDLRSLEGKNAVIVSDDWFPIELMVRSKFKGVSEPVTVSIKRFGIWIKNYYIHKGYYFKP